MKMFRKSSSYAKLATLMHIWNDNQYRGRFAIFEDIAYFDPHHSSFTEFLRHYNTITNLADSQLIEDVGRYNAENNEET